MICCPICDRDYDSDNNKLCPECNFDANIYSLTLKAQLPNTFQERLRNKIDWAKDFWQGIPQKQNCVCNSYLENNQYQEAIICYQKHFVNYLNNDTRISNNNVGKFDNLNANRDLLCPVCSSKYKEKDKVCDSCRYPIHNKILFVEDIEDIPNNIKCFFTWNKQIESWGQTLWSKHNTNFLTDSHFDTLYEHHQELNYYLEYLGYLNSLSDYVKERQCNSYFCKILQLKASYYIDKERYAKAAKISREGLKIAREIDDSEQTAKFLKSYAYCNFALEKYEEAINYYQQAIDIAKQIGDRELESESLNSISLCQSKIELDDRTSIILDLIKSANHYEANNQIQEAIGLVHKALEIYRERYVIEINAFAEAIDRTNEAKCLSKLEELYRKNYQAQKSIEYSQQALEIYQEQENYKEQGIVSNNLAIAYRDSNQYDHAIEYDEQALAIFQKLKDRKGEANVLRGLSDTYRALSKYSLSTDYAQKALAICQQNGDLKNKASCLYNLAFSFRYLGQVKQSIKYCQQALLVYENLNDLNYSELKEKKGLCYGVLALNYYSIKENQKSLRCIDRSLKLLQEVKDKFQYAYYGCYIRALILIELNEHSKAVESLIDAYRIFKSIEQNFWVSQVWEKLVSIENFYLIEDKFNEVIELYKLQLKIFEEVDDREKIGWVLFNVGKTFYSKKDYTQAIKYYEKSLLVAEKTNNSELQHRAIARLGYAYKENQELESALEYFERLINIYTTNNSLEQLQQILEHSLDIAHETENHNKIIFYYPKLLEVYRQLGNEHKQVPILYNIGLQYFHLSNYQDAKNYFKKYLSLAKKLNRAESQANAHFMLGKCYSKLNNNERAIPLFNNAKNIYLKLDNNRGTVESIREIANLCKEAPEYIQYTENKNDAELLREFNFLFDIADSYISNHSFNKALKCLDIALLLCEENNCNSDTSSTVWQTCKINQAKTFLKLGEIQYRLKQYSIALSNLQKAKDLYENLGNERGWRKAFRAYSAMSKKIPDEYKGGYLRIKQERLDALGLRASPFGCGNVWDLSVNFLEDRKLN